MYHVFLFHLQSIYLMKQSYYCLLCCLIGLSAHGQDNRPPLVLEGHFQTHGQLTFQGTSKAATPASLAQSLGESTRYLSHWEGATGIRLLTRKEGIGQEIRPLVLLVSPNYHTRFEVTKGPTYLSQLTGKVEGHSQSGDVYLKAVTAQVRLSVQAGDVVAENSDLEGELIAHKGDIRLSDVRGGYSALAKTGQVQATFSELFFRKQDQVYSMGIGQGSLQAVGARSGVVFEVVRGRIQVQKSQRQVSALVTQAGDIRLEGVSGQIYARTEGGSIWVELLAEAGKEAVPIEIDNRSGDVVVIVPKELQGLLVIECSQTRELERKKVVESAIDLSKAEWQEQRDAKDQVVGRSFRAVQPLGKDKSTEKQRLIRLRVRNGNLTIKTY